MDYWEKRAREAEKRANAAERRASKLQEQINNLEEAATERQVRMGESKLAGVFLERGGAAAAFGPKAASRFSAIMLDVDDLDFDEEGGFISGRFGGRTYYDEAQLADAYLKANPFLYELGDKRRPTGNEEDGAKASSKTGGGSGSKLGPASKFDEMSPEEMAAAGLSKMDPKLYAPRPEDEPGDKGPGTSPEEMAANYLNEKGRV